MSQTLQVNNFRIPTIKNIVIGTQTFEDDFKSALVYL